MTSAFQLREHLHDEAQVVVHLDMEVVLQGVEKHGFAVFWHDGLPEGRVDRILDGLTEEIALLGDEPQMVVVARFPIDGAADLVQIELAAEDGVPPGDVILALEVPVEGLSRDAGVAGRSRPR